MRHLWTTAAVTALCALAAEAWAAPQTQYLELVAAKHLRGAQAARTSSSKPAKSSKAKASKSRSDKASSRRRGRAHAAEPAHASRTAKSRRGRTEPVEAPRSARSRKAPVSTAIRTEAPAPVKVGRRDTLISIARKTGVPVEELARLNGLKKPYHVRLGARIKLPERRYYVVKSGDTLYSLAHRFGVEATDISAFNGMELGRPIRSGQKLYLPAGAEDREAARPEPAPPKPAPRPTPVRPQTPPTYEEPTPPETTSVGPQPYAPPPAEATIEPPGAEPSPSQPRPAPAFTQPPMAVPSTPPPVRPQTPVIQPGQTPPASSQGFELAPQRQLGYQPPPAPARGQIIPTSPAPTAADIVAAGRGKFAWPAGGSILSGFGPKASGQKNDGVDIGAGFGEPVRAAADGQVAYAGSLAEYGNLVLVKHDGGWVTAYAHMDRVLVKIRDQVVQGQPIGAVGQTGAADRPLLHFEIRYAPSSKDKAAPVDPMLLLPNH